MIFSLFFLFVYRKLFNQTFNIYNKNEIFVQFINVIFGFYFNYFIGNPIPFNRRVGMRKDLI